MPQPAEITQFIFGRPLSQSNGRHAADQIAQSHVVQLLATADQRPWQPPRSEAYECYSLQFHRSYYFFVYLRALHMTLNSPGCSRESSIFLETQFCMLKDGQIACPSLRSDRTLGASARSRPLPFARVRLRPRG